MELPGRKRMMVFAGGANEPLAQAVAEHLGIRLGRMERSQFASGEIYVRATESVRGADCFVMQTHSDPVNFHIMEQLLMIDALRRASAKRVTAVVPFFGYARQDKKVLPREPISARLICDLFIAAGADRIVSVDLHTGQIQGFFEGPFDHLTALPIFVEYLNGKIDGPVTVVSPDSGGVKRAEKYARHLDAYVAFVAKRRGAEEHNVSEALAMVGKVRDRHAVIVDDMVDTAGTAANAARLIRQKGAKSIIVMATHGVFSEPSIDNLKNAPVDEVVVTDTLPLPPEAEALDKITVLSVASIVAEALKAIFTESSVSEIFLGENV